MKTAVEVFFLTLGVLSAAFGLEGFLIPSHLIDGGVTGISMLLSKITGIELAFFLAFINLPFIVVGYHHFNRHFAIRCAISIVSLSMTLYFVDFPCITLDRLLDATFGGFFLGACIGLSIRGGGVLDGTEIMALLVSRRFPATIGDVILVFNIFIFGVAALFLNIESVLYSILTYYSASKTVDFVLHGIESYSGVLIISQKASEIRRAIVQDLGRGVTLLKGKGGYTEREQEVLFCVITRLEIPKIKSITTDLDPAAFLVVHPVSDVHGGIIKKFLTPAETHS